MKWIASTDAWRSCVAAVARRYMPCRAPSSVGRMWTQLGEKHGTHVPIPPSPLTSRRPALARLLLYISGTLPMGAPSPGVHPDTEGDLM